MKKFVPDTSAIIDGKISEMIRKNKIEGSLIIPEFVISELENQANSGKEIGFVGLDEIKLIRDLAIKHKIHISKLGRKPTAEEIRLASGGRIDALIRDIARRTKAVLVTADYVQAKAAEAEAIPVIFLERQPIIKFQLESYFDEKTMSVHLKEGYYAQAKRGLPGKFKLMTIDNEILTRERLENIAKEIMEMHRLSDDSFIEIGKHGVTVIQLKNYRIVITRPVFSEKMEITAVRPIAKMNLEHYKLNKNLLERLEKRAEGILVAGPPGHGKSTFAQALAEFYQKQGKIVKTMENPRDMQLGPEITQYGPLEGDMAKTANILLLVRPDLTVFDEVRQTKDFKVYADMRLAGVGMIGVVHSTEAIDAIHRFLDRVELGLIPQIVDTIIFIKEGMVKQIYTLNLIVKVPTGMIEQDLARPVIEVNDFDTSALEYEIYTYGEQTVVIPIKQKQNLKFKKVAAERIENEIRKFTSAAEVNLISDSRAIVKVREKDIARLIGRKGKRIARLEKKLGIALSVEPIVETFKKNIESDFEEKGPYIILNVKEKYTGLMADVFKGAEYLFSATIGKRGQIKVRRDADVGEKLLQAHALKNLKILI